MLELSPVEMVRCAAAAGYARVGLRVLPATDHEPVRDMVGGTPMVREVAATLADTGVRVLDIEILRLRPDTDVVDFAPCWRPACGSARTMCWSPATIRTRPA